MYYKLYTKAIWIGNVNSTLHSVIYYDVHKVAFFFILRRGTFQLLSVYSAILASHTAKEYLFH